MLADMALCSSDGLRPASKSDFDKFQALVENREGWVKQYHKRGIEVFTKSQEGTAIKILKVCNVTNA